MIHIFTLKYGKKYSEELVNELYYETKRKDTTFYCYTDNENNLNPEIKIIKLKKRREIKKHWYKIDFFQKDFVKYDKGDQCIIMDIDQVIVDNIDPLLYYPVKQNTLVSYKPWYESTCEINGGWYKFNSNELDYIHTEFNKNIEFYQTKYYLNGDTHFKYYGEQNFVADTAQYIETMPEDLYSGKYSTKNCRIIHYNGLSTPIL